MADVNRRVMGLLLAAALLMIGAGGALFVNLVHFRDSFHLVEHTNEVLRQLSAAEVGLFQAESDERGWILSGDASYLQAYHRAAERVALALSALDALAADTPDQTRRLRDLHAMIEARLDAFSRVVELGPARREEALSVLASERQRQAASAISDELEAMR